MSERAEGTRRRLYGAQDMVRISSSSCAGCGACCRGMSDTIVPDPYDVWQMGLITGKTFEELMGAGIDLHVEEGVILPHLMMKKDTGGCYFLGEDGRCTIHAYRPGICRLFPLGRQYDEEKTSYFIVPEGCVKGGLSKVRIDKWLGIPDLPAYEDFKSRWHSFIRTLTARIAAEQSDEIRRSERSRRESPRSSQMRFAETSICIFFGCFLWSLTIKTRLRAHSMRMCQTE